VSVSMETDQNSACLPRISSDKANQLLPVYGVIAYLPTDRWYLDQRRGLKENALLLVPEKKQCTENERDNYERNRHVCATGGFQRVCIAGNLHNANSGRNLPPRQRPVC